MRNLFIMITVTALLSSCGAVSKVTKHRSLEKSKQNSSLNVKSETDLSTIDKSVTTTTEKLSTPVTTPSVSGNTEKKINEADKASLNDAKAGLMVINDQFLTLTQIYSEKDSVLKTMYLIKPRNVPVPTERTTVVQNDIRTNQSSKEETKQDSSSNNVNRNLDVERKPDYFSIVLWSFGVIGAIVLFGWIRNRFF